MATGFVKNGAKVCQTCIAWRSLANGTHTCQVYICSRSARDCDATAAELNALGPGKCISIPADLQSFEAVVNLVKTLSSKEKALHVLVNNAGAVWGADVDNYPASCLIYWILIHNIDDMLLDIGLGVHKSVDTESATRIHPDPTTSSPPPIRRRTRWQEWPGLQRSSKNNQRQLYYQVNKHTAHTDPCVSLDRIG